MTTTHDGTIEITEAGQFLLIHPVSEDELFDSFDELVESHPHCEKYRYELFGRAETMTTATHTPGPWTIDDNVVFGALDTRICTVDVGDDDEPTVTGQGELPDGQGRENARLIAAAPDLLAALQDLLTYANNYSDSMGESGMAAKQLGVAADSVSVAGMARAAIAKATYETAAAE